MEDLIRRSDAISREERTMRACDDCKYYFGETCEHPDIGDDFEFGGLGDTFQWFDETPDWCPLKGADDE